MAAAHLRRRLIGSLLLARPSRTAYGSAFPAFSGYCRGLGLRVLDLGVEEFRVSGFRVERFRG